ncbi:mitochondrial carrier protein [Protomyces lactucae-debilis]|uniref:Mitochondrial carrier protein n=1 Tax=Protomyces lactucae-debilis TaxID=2754530 RepID=A0A1Y2FAF6_PROLT|nr:mitochondrial carrier protein [Protomyces lactucae-debilis]ORY80899.1 mitochondrial carrier protein [Protomyces lactucae-debilis]
MSDAGFEAPVPVPNSVQKAADEQVSTTRSKPPISQLPITGFVAGIFSGVTKLVIGHPFDTVKVRLQVSGERFNNSVLQCLSATVKKEGFRGLYKGGTPPLFGWAVMDAVMLGSLTQYRRLLLSLQGTGENMAEGKDAGHLSIPQHCLAGLGAGLTVSFVATPIEHVKARLQVQYDVASRAFRGPIECSMHLLRTRKLYNGLVATMAQRSWFSVFWGSYAVAQQQLDRAKYTANWSNGAKSFWAGGMAASIYWVFAFPADVIKQRIMTDHLTQPRYAGWRDCARQVWQEAGLRGLYRGFLPAALRSFPTNASAVFVFDTTMRFMTERGF